MVSFKLTSLAALAVEKQLKANRSKMLVQLLQSISSGFAKVCCPSVVLTQLFAGLFCPSGQLLHFFCDTDSQTVPGV